MKYLKVVLAVSLIINLFALALFVKKIYDNTHPIISYYLDRNELFEELQIDSSSIVFLGTSLTQNFELTELLKKCNIKNRGINGDITEGILNRIAPILKAKPQKIVIEAGINDLATGISEQIILENYKKIIERILSESPETKIYINSLFPTVAEGGEFPTYCNEEINRGIIKLNKKLKTLTKDGNVIFIDTHSAFQVNGQLNTLFSVDGVHLNGKGYRLWAKILMPFVNEP